MRAISFCNARNRLKNVLDEVANDRDYTIISRKDAEDVVVMSLNQFNSLMKNVNLLQRPANAAHASRMPIRCFRLSFFDNMHNICIIK